MQSKKIKLCVALSLLLKTDNFFPNGRYKIVKIDGSSIKELNLVETTFISLFTLIQKH